MDCNDSVTINLKKYFEMKYGCNPHQKPAALYFREGKSLPFEILNGKPGYINYCDAFNSWQLVKELKEATGLASATSFKHVSPAGAAVGVELDDTLKQVYELQDRDLNPLSSAYIRARDADPRSSFGDYIASSETVEENTASIIKGFISDGIIAPDYTPEALEILKQKKKGNYPIIKIDPSYEPEELEYRDIYGITLCQKRNNEKITKEIVNNIVTKNKDMPESAVIDIICTTIAVKYTQSNTVGYGVNGQVIGLGAGQQSRIDCTMLAGRKAATWFLRQHPKALALKFNDEVKIQEKINCRVRYVEGGMTVIERKAWESKLKEIPPDLTEEEKQEWLAKMKNVVISSDAFFPFRDNIDQASRYGVKYILQPAGTIREEEVINAADEYGMVMALSNLRLFHH